MAYRQLNNEQKFFYDIISGYKNTYKHLCASPKEFILVPIHASIWLWQRSAKSKQKRRIAFDYKWNGHIMFHIDMVTGLNTTMKYNS